MQQQFFFSGMKVNIARKITVPNFKINSEVKLIDEFRINIDKWCLEFFGGEQVESVQNGIVLNANGELIMNIQTYNALIKELPAL